MGTYYNDNGELKLISGATLWADAPIGAINAYGGATAPNGWLLCQGQAISRTEYAELFAVIGTAYGSGDGSTTFNLPDPREAALVGAGTNVLNSGSIAAHNAVSLGAFQDDQFQSHAHHVYINNDPNYPVLSNKNLKADGEDYWNVNPSGTYPIVASTEYEGNRAGTTTHGKQLGVNYIIKAKQVAAPVDFAGIAEAAGTEAAEEVVALKQNITDNSLNTLSKTVPGAINEVAGHAKLIGGDDTYTWVDIPTDISASGKLTRVFIHDQDLFLGAQIWTNGSLTREGKFYFRPTPQQITFLNGVTTAEPANCNIIDFGAFIVVNLANVTIPNDFAQYNYFMQLPAFATSRINFVVPTATGYEVVYIDANTRELRITNKVTQQIFINMIIPVGPARY